MSYLKSALSEIVKYEFLTHRLNFGTGSPFSEGSGSVSVPLYKACHRKTSRHATLSKRDFSTKRDYCEIFENTYFEQHLQAAASEQLIQVLSILKFSRNCFWLRKHVIKLLKRKLPTQDIPWLNLHPLPRISIISCLVWFPNSFFTLKLQVTTILNKIFNSLHTSKSTF